MIGHRSFVVEAKGEAANPRQHANYFVGGLGELVEQMADPATTYAIAQPDNKQLRCSRATAEGRPAAANLAVFSVARADL
jgi:hypothetical protein